MRPLVRTSVGRMGLICVLACASTTALAAEEVFSRAFTVTPGGLLTVNASAADVIVSGGESTQVVVRMTVKDSSDKSVASRLSASQSAAGVTVEMQRDDWFGGLFSWWGAWDTDARIEIVVPRRYRVEMKTSGGDMQVSHLDGNATGKTSGGDVNLEDVTGEVSIRTSGGDVVATAVRGDIEASTSGGDIRLLRVDGKIRAKTSGGDVQCELIGANRGVSVVTSGGDIHLTMAQGNKATLDAATSGGDIVADFPVTSDDSSGKRRLSGPINGGGEAIYARTSGGDITLRAAP